MSSRPSVRPSAASKERERDERRVADRRTEKKTKYDCVWRAMFVYYVQYIIIYYYVICVSGVYRTGWGRPPLNGFHYGLFLLRTPRRHIVESSTSPKKKKTPFFISFVARPTCIVRCSVALAQYLLSKASPLGILCLNVHTRTPYMWYNKVVSADVYL